MDTDKHRCFSRKAFTCRVISIFFTNPSYLCSSVSICGFPFFLVFQLPDLGITKYRLRTKNRGLTAKYESLSAKRIIPKPVGFSCVKTLTSAFYNPLEVWCVRVAISKRNKANFDRSVSL